MKFTFRNLRRIAFCIGLAGFTPIMAHGATPSVDQALKLAPIQKDVDYDAPAAADIPKCTIKAEKIGNQTGWVVRGPNGGVLREFVDTNGDNVVDRWSYYKDGIEVYRDIDENFNGKADQYRWLNTAGIRWGIDKDEDGKIDSWKMISPEEVTSEAVYAVREKDPARFNRLLMTPAEAKALGLGTAKSKLLNERISAAPASFNELVKRQKAIGPNTEWAHFGGNRPGLIPKGSDGADDDIVAYENVMAMVETDGKDGQLSIGTLVKVGDNWRLINAPSIPDPTKVAEATGFFYQQTLADRGSDGNGGNVAGDGPSEKVQKMMDELSKIDEAVARSTTDSQRTQLNDRRAELILQIADEIGDKDRPTWIRQFADTLSAAAQTGTYPGGVEKLKAMVDKLQAATNEDPSLLAYVKFRYLTGDYGAKLQKGDDFVKVQSQWLDNLEQYVKDYPKAQDSAEALLQLGIAQEFAGQEEKAKTWYKQLVGGFDGTQSANKARGALNRLDSVGQTMNLRGKSVDGKPVDIAAKDYRGKYVLVQYWATWCEPCKTDFAQLKELYNKYGKNGFAIVSVNLDTNLPEAADYLSKNKLPWPSVWEQGGLDSRLANEMGILTLPTMILVDDKGKVINRSVHITELENDLKSVLK
jgi:thiol-disulfide isomerase/thioredoxin